MDLESWGQLQVIPDYFKKLFEGPVESGPFIQPRDGYLGLLESVPDIYRVRGFANTHKPSVALLVRDSALAEPEFLSRSPEEIPWRDWNRQLWFYSDSRNSESPFARYFTIYTAHVGNFRIDKGFGPPYCGLVPLFNTDAIAFENTLEAHLNNGKHLFSPKKELVEGEELVKRALSSMEAIISLSPKLKAA